MPRFLRVVAVVVVCVMFPVMSGQQFESDTVVTSAGKVVLTFIGHGTLMVELGGKVVQIDPWGEIAEYSSLPKADIVLISHEHRDHLDPDAIAKTRTPTTTVLLTEACAEKVKGGVVMVNGDSRTVDGIRIQAVAAYNVVHKRPDGSPFHPKGRGNGYVLAFGDARIYVAGDTEGTPEMQALQGIDIAFLPMNLPYTMTPEMVSVAAKAFRPKILYPYHFGETDPRKLVALLKDSKGVEVRIRKMK